jgi:hypothetical protein
VPESPDARASSPGQSTSRRRKIRFLLRYRDKDSPRNFESVFPYEGIGILRDAGASAEGKRKRERFIRMFAAESESGGY